MNQVSVSVCVPVFNSEKTLYRALDSVAAQTFSDWEIVLVNDGSSGKDERGWDCRKIVKAFLKEKKLSKKKITYICHHSNLGLVEARRTAVENARGTYICILDSDDYLLPNALQTLYDEAVASGADIVHSGAQLWDQGKNQLIEEGGHLKKINLFYDGILSNQEIIHAFLIDKTVCGYLWGKLFLRETYLEALSHIPFTKCVMAEDYLQFFYLALVAKKYSGVKGRVYSYSEDTGISATKISSLSVWEQICSTANVFTIIFSEIQDGVITSLTPEELEALKFERRSYLAVSIKRLQDFVVPELQVQARSMLCDYWGESFVERMEEAIQEKEEEKK